MKKFVKAARFFLKNEVKGPGYLELVDGKFGDFSKNVPADAEIIDYGQQWIAPGLVDTHIHGFKNHDVMDNDFEGIKVMSEALLSCGVTSFLPTTLTSTHEKLQDVAQTIGDHYQEVTGAKIQGIYFEGPFFTPEHKGAQNPSYFSDPSIEVFDKWQEAAGGLIKKIAMAPERTGAVEFVKHVTQQGVVVSLGHSDATIEQAAEVVEAGASVFVHVYNGMRGLHHREPGMVGAAMTLRNVFGEMICDGHHVHPKAAQAYMDVRGRDHVALITDCMMAGGMPDGDYILGEFPVTVANGTARLKQDNNLAGSILKLKEGVKNVVDWGIATPEEAIAMASSVAATSCKIDDVCGFIAPGRDADFIVLDPDLELAATYLDGKKRYER
ncbi:N-acetylglucosamine-6-phosphate deacetylase [Enterococcus timonensis]|uniref:N-acetylglucosamine-6-phosphate deacetylase n=1 Tax=Enterococcus timonensis TaxID=1852364 RepID=UPI0008DA037E|nr:N-acetylglucosamine-6-phosphate deacetylase [Enterococcus timonensis]